MIAEWTEAQASELTHYRDHWIRTGLGTEPADRDAAEQVINAAYRASGAAAPRIIWCGSPLAMALSRALLLSGLSNATPAKRAAKVVAGIRGRVLVEHWDLFWGDVLSAAGEGRTIVPGRAIDDRLCHRVRDEVRCAVQQRIPPCLWQAVGEQLGKPIRAKVAAGAWGPIGRALWDAVGGSVALREWGMVRGLVRDAIRLSLSNQRDASWLGFYDFLGKACGVAAETHAIQPVAQAARAVGWWLPHENICWVSERPSLLRQDEGGTLHAPTGPAALYPDGWAIHAWRGTPVPGDWIDRPDCLTAKIALAHPRLDQRRAACEILGWDRVLDGLDIRRIQKDSDPTIGELVEVDLPELGRERFLRVLCGTGRRFAIPVPPAMQTALDANAWTYGLDAAAFNPEVRT